MKTENKEAAAGLRRVRVVSLEWRDGQQSLLGTRVKTEDMLPILPLMDAVGYDAIEMWGGATFDVALRYLEDDPWDRLKLFKKICKKTPLRMLLRSQNLVGYKQYPDDIVEKFIECAANDGVDQFVIMDGLNDVRNCEVTIKAIKKMGKMIIASIPYTLSPVHTVEKYVEIVKEYERLGVDVIELEDMAGMISPEETKEMITAFKKNLKIPVYYHAHCTGGMADICYWEAIKAGAEVINCNVSSMSRGTAHPPLESFIVALRNTPYDTGLNLELVEVINNYFVEIRKKYKEFESKFTGVNIGVLKHKVPGGMLSNLELQLKQMNATDREAEIFEEVARVSKDFGYPPLATPFAQMVGAQATLNVLLGERYKTITNETRNYIKGLYGRPTGPVSEDLIKKVLGNERPITERPGSLLPPAWEQMKKESAAFARCDEDVLTYAMFPQVAEGFLKKKYHLT